MLFVRKRIKNRFLCSFLYYVPYTVLAAMTFPTIFFVTDHIISGILACVVCIAMAYFKRGLVTVAASGAAAVLVCELVITYLI